MKIDIIKSSLVKQCLFICLILLSMSCINLSVYADEATDTLVKLSAEQTDTSEEESWLEPEEDPVVPTQYQWMALCGIALLFMVVSIRSKAHKLTMEGEFVEYNITKTFSVPLHKSVFKFALFLTGAAALIGFAICLTIFNSVYMPDIIGVAIAGPLFAYLIHLLYLMERHHRESN